MNVYKGKIITCDAENTVAEYLVENKGRIEYIGASAGPFCHPIDLPFYPEIAGQAVQHVSPSSAPIIYGSCPEPSRDLCEVLLLTARQGPYLLSVAR